MAYRRGAVRKTVREYHGLSESDSIYYAVKSAFCTQRSSLLDYSRRLLRKQCALGVCHPQLSPV